MAAVSTMVAVGSMAMSAAGAMQASAAGKAGASAMRGQAIHSAMEAGKSAGAALVNADNVMFEGQQKADLVLAQAREFRGSQKVAIAASGFVTDVGTAQAHIDQTDKLAAADALAILHSTGNYVAAQRVSADAMIESGVSRAQGFVAQSEATYRQGQATALQGWANTFSYGLKAYDAAKAPKTTNSTVIGPSQSGK